MQIVIDISENIYNLIVKGEESRDFVYKSDLMRAILKGTPLPKGHGDLIDVKQIVTEDECIWNNDGSCTTITTYDIDSTPIIIEADKVERGDKE